MWMMFPGRKSGMLSSMGLGRSASLSLVSATSSLPWQPQHVTVPPITFHYTNSSHSSGIVGYERETYSVVTCIVLEESPCPLGCSRTNLGLQVLVLGPQSPWKCYGLCIVQTVRYVWPCDVHKFCRTLPPPCMRIRWRMSYLLMSDITYISRLYSVSYLLICQQVSILHCNPVLLSSR